MQPASPEPVFLNLEYFFFLAYRAVAKVFSYIFSLEFLYLIKIVATILIILLIAAICYCLVRLYEMKAEDKAKAKAMVGSSTSAPVSAAGVQTTESLPVGPRRNEVWERIRDKMLSENPSDWRLAIIEADIYMDRCLDAKGYYGETVGDKLKGVAAGQLASVQVAWEAHKVRNRIAHDGADFVLTQPEVRRVLSYYEIVFRDLDIID